MKMGKMASKLRFITRPFINYNVESRAQKVISNPKPSPAPTYPSIEKLMDNIRNNPELLNKGKISPTEKQHLSQIFVTSTGTNPEIKIKQSLPEDRHTHEEPAYGFETNKPVPQGKLSFRDLSELLGKHITDPVKNSAEVLALEYKLDLQTTINLVDYFRAFNVYVKPKEEKKLLAETARLLKKPFVDSAAVRKPNVRDTSWIRRIDK